MTIRNTPFDSFYEEFIYVSRYSRWLETENRRETWGETVSRYINFMKKKTPEIPDSLWGELEDGIYNLEVMPSMRAMMTAGPALERDNVAGYNCSYLPVDDIKAFDEAMYILLCGTGVGFSVERQYIQKLPEIPEELFDSETTIVVKDSKEGWAKAFRQLIALLYSGEIPKWDISRVRPAGARLKTFGGRASGPAPLEELFVFTIQKFRGARGRKLTSIEAHDILCKVGEVVVVGGVRRSAMISFSNLTDERMRQAKSGSWWEQNPQRALANNSIAYTEKPDVGIFMKEWSSLYESKSGERGIFNRESSKKKAAQNGRRDHEHEFGSNPCFPGNTLVAVADGRNAVSIQELAEANVSFPVYSGRYTKLKTWTPEIKNAVAFKTGTKELLRVVLSNGDSFECTPNHRLAMPNGEYVEAKDSLGLELEKFFTYRDKNYRIIKSYSNGFNKQHRMIWEHHNGNIEPGFVIDHIVSGSKDYIENLQTMTLRAHNLKTGSEVQGENNFAHKIKDRNKWKNNLSSKNSLENNGKFKGLSNEELIEIGKKILKSGQKLSYDTMRAFDSRCPLSFSKNRFGGKFSTFKNICLGKEEYSAPTIPEYIENEPEERTLHNKIFVQEILYEGKVEDVYDLTVEDNHNFFIITSGDEDFRNCEGVLVHNCNEIILRPYQFCNLTEVVIREGDEFEDLARKVRLATILGTIQSTLIHFPYLRKIWTKNTAEERLLGVSLTGQMDNKKLVKNKIDLQALREIAVETNKEWAEVLDIPQSTAVTCTKPSGTISQLVNSSSGIHARYAPYYIRSVRADNKDPLTQFMKDSGIPFEADIMKPDQTTVFYFPIKSPKSSVMRDDMDAIQQLEYWKKIQDEWCEHKPSVTINVKEHEWPEVGGWVYKNFDSISGISFLPHTEHSYKQAPYQECTKEEYEEMKSRMPEMIDWTKLSEYEKEDQTASSSTFACSGGACEIVDLV